MSFAHYNIKIFDFLLFEGALVIFSQDVEYFMDILVMPGEMLLFCFVLLLLYMDDTIIHKYRKVSKHHWLPEDGVHHHLESCGRVG
jgi:hypothetical protein